MARLTALALVSVAAALGAGCGTVHNCKSPTYPPPGNPDASVCRVYGGVRGDVAVMAELPWRHLPTYLDYVTIPVMCAVDLVCTGVGDTVTLPYTGWAELRRAFRDPPAPTPAVVEVAPAPPAPGVNSSTSEVRPNTSSGSNPSP